MSKGGGDWKLELTVQKDKRDVDVLRDSTGFHPMVLMDVATGKPIASLSVAPRHQGSSAFVTRRSAELFQAVVQRDEQAFAFRFCNLLSDQRIAFDIRRGQDKTGRAKRVNKVNLLEPDTVAVIESDYSNDEREMFLNILKDGGGTSVSVANDEKTEQGPRGTYFSIWVYPTREGTSFSDAVWCCPDFIAMERPPAPEWGVSSYQPRQNPLFPSYVPGDRDMQGWGSGESGGFSFGADDIEDFRRRQNEATRPGFAGGGGGGTFDAIGDFERRQFERARSNFGGGGGEWCGTQSSFSGGGGGWGGGASFGGGVPRSSGFELASFCAPSSPSFGADEADSPRATPLGSPAEEGLLAQGPRIPSPGFDAANDAFATTLRHGDVRQAQARTVECNVLYKETSKPVSICLSVLNPAKLHFLPPPSSTLRGALECAAAFFEDGNKRMLALVTQVFPEKECVICLSTHPELLFVKCGHKAACKECGARVEKCPLCRAAILARIEK
jgi:hypothetical protein